MAAPFDQNPRNSSADFDIYPFPSRLSTPNDALVLPTAYGGDQQTFSFLVINDGQEFKKLPLRNVSDGVRKALELSKAGADIYFAPAGFGSAESRKGNNVVSVRGFWLDFDCGEDKAAAGKGHATVQLVWDALVRICPQIGIPLPTHVVLSGGGLHCHWLLTESLDPAAWKVTAKRVKRLTEVFGLRADPSRTADIASLMRLPGTWNYKYDPPRPVKLIRTSREFIDTATFCRQIDEAHSQYSSAPVVVETRTPVDRDQREYGPPDLAQVRTALSTIDPDCEEQEWTFTIRALAREVRKYPHLEEPLRNLTMEWSRGDLWHEPSEKWREPGGNGLTGEQYFDQVWNRFLREEDRDGPVITIATLFYKARLAGAPLEAAPVVIPADPLAFLQQRYGLILQGGDLYGVRLIDGDPQQLFIKERAFRRLMRRDLKQRFPGHDPHPIVDEFFDHPLTTLFRGVYLHPTQGRPGYLNLWRGPVLEPKAGDCNLILAFLRDVICAGHEVLYEYLMNYLAHMIQRPEEKPGVIIILIGGQGIGKGTFGHLLRRIFGDSYLHLGRIETVLGNFNGALERSLVVFLDEAFFHGDRRHTESLQSLVTDPLITINEKHQPTRQVESFHRFVIATNAEHVKHTDRDDRRDFVLPVSNRHQGDSAYWVALYAEIDGDGTAALMHELLERDISNFDVRRRPVTAALIDQRRHSLDDVGRWLDACLQEGFIGDPETGWPEFVPTDDALAMVEEYAGVRRHRKLSRQVVVRRLLELCPSIRQEQRRLPFGGRPRGLVLPSLEVARKEFEQYMGGEVPW